MDKVNKENNTSGQEQNKDVLSYMKAKVRLIDNLQEKTLYDGQPEYYRQMQ